MATPSEMEAAAEKAATQLPTLKTAEDVAEWIRKNFMTAGYGHLCRRLLKHFKPSLPEIDKKATPKPSVFSDRDDIPPHELMEMIN